MKEGGTETDSQEKPLDDEPPSVVHDAGGETLAKETKSKKGITGSQPRGNHNVFTQYPKHPNCEVCKKTENNTSQVLDNTYRALGR